ncbi:hypothetical protein BM525_20460 (plasmid) [Alteromonas mediterranea]|uniref:Uncharacterized protein n=1 Tax=Alteromonas mediterranea TaxID=314275 RepID=A0AAC9NTI2_9ALTE|nr:hypothetical protein [Alteromonas mediterranea]APD92253.1 hypothetical protein BM524_20265 [Alteromonas mediterranea]APE00108.1 hypothetical protein BM525_20460 [Alteromonas mediterranea]
MNQEHIHVSYEIDDVFAGKKTVNDVSPKAKEWLTIMAYNLALGVADLPCEEQAPNADEMKKKQPILARMVLPIAKSIITQRNKGQMNRAPSFSVSQQDA